MNTRELLLKAHELGYQSVLDEAGRLVGFEESQDAALTRHALKRGGITPKDLMRARALAHIDMPDEEIERVLYWYSGIMKRMNGFGRADRFGIKSERARSEAA